MGVSRVTGVADSAPSFCKLLSFVLTGQRRICAVSVTSGNGQISWPKVP